MKRYSILFTILLSFCLGTTQAVAQQVQYALRPSYHYGRISSYSDGLARVKIAADTIGYIDRSGELVLKLNYNYAGSFHDGRAWVAVDKDGGYKYGYINKQGTLVIPCVYDKVKDFSDNRAAVKKDGHWQIINRNGRIIMDDSILAIKENGYGDKIPHIYHNNLLLVSNGHQFGYANTSGKVVIPFSFDIAMNFSGGRALVAVEVPMDFNTSKMKKHYQNRYVKSLDSLLHNLPRRRRTKRQWMLIDTAGRVCYTFPGNVYYDWYEKSSLSTLFLISASKSDSRWGQSYGVMNENGEIIIKPTYSKKLFPFSDGVTIAPVEGKKPNNSDGYMFVLDSTGKKLSKIPFKTDYGLMYNSKEQFHEGLLAVKISRKDNNNWAWGFMDKHGKMVIPPRYDEVSNFHEGRAIVVTQDGKIGVLKNPLKS